MVVSFIKVSFTFLINVKKTQPVLWSLFPWTEWIGSVVTIFDCIMFKDYTVIGTIRPVRHVGTPI